jgi:drug/metabolite transporter (DMT)-like permease
MSFSSQPAVIRAGLFMVLAMGLFTTNDTLIKLLGNSLPLGEIVFFRGLFASIFLAVAATATGALPAFPHAFQKAVLWRSLLDLGGTFLFIAALMNMPIANLTSIMQVVPLVVTAFAAFFLAEKVGGRRIAAIVVGLIGVMFIVKPSPASFNVYDAFALLLVLCVAFRDIVTRNLSLNIPILIIALANAMIVTAGGLAVVLFETWVTPKLWQFLQLAVAAIFLSLGYLFMVATIRMADISSTAVYRYTVVAFALISGIFVFGEFPDGWALFGIALIIASGLYVLNREARLRAQQSQT